MKDNGVMICPKCGNEMHYKDRFCFHCGYINYDNNSNDFLVKYDKKAKKQLKKEGRKNPANNKFFAADVKNGSNSGKPKFYHSVEEYREEVAKVGAGTREERMRNILIRVGRVVSLIAFILFVFFGYKFIVSKQEIYVNQSIEIVNQIKKEYGSNNFKKCNKSDEYLFEFTSATLKKDYNLDYVSPYLSNEYKGYVLVTKVNGKYTYRISLTDGTFGIREVDIDELKTKNVLPYYKLNVPAINTECK